MSEIKRTKPKKRKAGSTFTLRGANCHRFLRAFDPTFPLHPDERSSLLPAAPEARDDPPSGVETIRQDTSGGL